MAHDKNAAVKEVAKKRTIPVLRVTARGKSFRRAGFAFGESPVDIPLASLTDKQVGALKSEKMLVAVEAEAEDANRDGLPD